MQITDITSQRKSEQRVNIFLDGSYWLSLDIVQVIELGLRVGREITPAQKNQIEHESSFGKAYAAALNLISIRARSIKEIKDYAWRKKWDDDITARVIERLEQKKYLNDPFFAEKWVSDRARLKPLSKRKLTQELQQKGIQAEAAVTAVSGYNEQAALQRVIQKKQARYSGNQPKFIHYLMQQGFAYNDIKRALNGDDTAD